VPWHGLYSLIHFLLCIFQEAFVVAVVLFLQPCAHIAACLTPMSWHALSCFQRLPGDKHKSCHVLPSPVTSTCRDMLCHVMACRAHVVAQSQAPVGSFFQRLPGDKHKSCHGMASTASSIFFYASFKKPLLWPSCYFSSLVPISRHAFRPCRGMPCHVSSDCPVTSASRAMSCLAR
jgi:hypothetical protein